jgi:predicted O-linked N-acetylglucosamine transferase (SPINDLY family)
LGNNYKITPQFFGVWMRLLQKVEDSVLWLSLDNTAVETNLRKEAQSRGVDPARLIFAPFVKRIEQHYARYRLADLYLDTAYNGHVTTTDALWAGLPVLTRAGRSFAGRVAGSLLHAVGLPELITHGLDEYEAAALKLAGDRRLLGALRARLEQNKRSAPLFDADRFRRHIESAYVTMWDTRQRGEKPKAFSVLPIE